MWNRVRSRKKTPDHNGGVSVTLIWRRSPAGGTLQSVFKLKQEHYTLKTGEGMLNPLLRMTTRRPGSVILPLHQAAPNSWQTLVGCEAGAEGLGGGFLKGPLLVSLQTSWAYGSL